MEPRAKVVSGPGKHSIYTHFPKDRKCDICLRTKWTASSRTSDKKWYRESTSFCTHFQKDRDCEVCERIKITRAPFRKRIGEAALRAEFSGDLTTADHKVISEGCESRDNHRYAVVVQDLATQWIQAYPCKTKLLRNSRRANWSSWSRRGKQKSFTLTILWNLARPVKN